MRAFRGCEVVSHCGFDLHFLFFKRFYFFIFREGMGRREGNINVWLPLESPLLGIRPTTQVHTLTGNQNRDPLVHRLVLNPLSHTSQG